MGCHSSNQRHQDLHLCDFKRRPGIHKRSHEVRMIDSDVSLAQHVLAVAWRCATCGFTETRIEDPNEHDDN